MTMPNITPESSDSKVSQFFENNAQKESVLEERRLAKRYFKNSFAIISGVLLLVVVTSLTIFFSYTLKNATQEKNTKFNTLKTERTQEVESEVKKIIQNIGKSSNLVYNMSLFHVSPRVVLEEAERAIYLGPDKVITNENVTFTNYNTLTFGLVTQDLENFAILIKKLKKLYSDTFDIAGLQNFNITYETDDLGIKTGKVFYTTDIQLKYKKDPGTNLVLKGVLDSGEEDTTEKTSLYENNVIAFDIFKDLTIKLAEKRKSESKKDFYVTPLTTDPSIYLSTDIEYLGRNIYYVTEENTLSDLFQLNEIGTKEDYNTLKGAKIKLMLTTSSDGQQYGICTKVPKKEEELTELEKQETTISHTKVISDGGLAPSIKQLCELL